MAEKNSGSQPKPKKKPAPKKAGAGAKKRIKVSRLGYYIIIFGWLTIAVNLLLPKLLLKAFFH